MSSRFGIDEAWARLTPAQCVAAGKTFVVGYISEDNTGKNITRAEIDAYRAVGIAVLLVYEYSTTAVHGGAAKGHRDAAIAIAGARAVGYPPGCAIGFAVDEDTRPDPSIIDAYCRAFTADVRAARYRSMDYGGYACVKRAADLGLADLHWQTYAWSGGAWDPRAAIRQVQNGVFLDGRDIDLDTALVDDFGAWMPGPNTNGALTVATIDDVYTLLVNDIDGGSLDAQNVLHWRLRGIQDQDDALLAAGPFGKPATPGLKQLAATLDQVLAVLAVLKTGGVDVAALAAQVAAAVIAHHDALTDADQPEIEAAVRTVLHGA